MAALLDHYRPQSTLAFCNTKAHCRELADALRAQGYTALALSAPVAAITSIESSGIVSDRLGDDSACGPSQRVPNMPICLVLRRC